MLENKIETLDRAAEIQQDYGNYIGAAIKDERTFENRQSAPVSANTNPGEGTQDDNTQTGSNVEGQSEGHQDTRHDEVQEQGNSEGTGESTEGIASLSELGGDQVLFRHDNRDYNVSEIVKTLKNANLAGTHRKQVETLNKGQAVLNKNIAQMQEREKRYVELLEEVYQMFPVRQFTREDYSRWNAEGYSEEQQAQWEEDNNQMAQLRNDIVEKYKNIHNETPIAKEDVKQAQGRLINYATELGTTQDAYINLVDPQHAVEELKGAFQAVQSIYGMSQEDARNLFYKDISNANQLRIILDALKTSMPKEENVEVAQELQPIRQGNVGGQAQNMTMEQRRQVADNRGYKGAQRRAFVNGSWNPAQGEWNPNILLNAPLARR